MEDYLRGRNGIREIATLNGTVVSSKITQNVTPGNTIKLTIDSEFQRKVQGVLDDFIKYLNDTPKYKNVIWFIVVLDAKTGAVLALATAPTTLDSISITMMKFCKGQIHPSLTVQLMDFIVPAQPLKQYLQQLV